MFDHSVSIIVYLVIITHHPSSLPLASSLLLFTSTSLHATATVLTTIYLSSFYFCLLSPTQHPSCNLTSQCHTYHNFSIISSSFHHRPCMLIRLNPFTRPSVQRNPRTPISTWLYTTISYLLTVACCYLGFDIDAIHRSPSPNLCLCSGPFTSISPFLYFLFSPHHIRLDQSSCTSIRMTKRQKSNDNYEFIC